MASKKTPPAPAPVLVDETRPYPDTGPLAVAARVGLIVLAAGLIYATAFPGAVVPRLFYSNNLEHFAAFYVVALAAAAAFPRRRLRWLALVFGVGAAALECLRLIEHPRLDLIEMWSADFGGVLAGYVPMVVQRFRSLFPKKAA